VTTILMGVVAVAIIVGMIWLMMRIERVQVSGIERRRESVASRGEHRARAGRLQRAAAEAAAGGGCVGGHSSGGRPQQRRRP